MKKFVYYINAYLKNGTEITVGTNDIDIALREFFRYTNQGEHTDLVDGFTGEVYIISNTDEPYITDQWALTVLGWLVKENWGQGLTNSTPCVIIKKNERK